ncbi:hypothetical protein ACFWM1_07025 [Nocardia sp. NPDC058379]|uniref:VMAP-C domain-containing protein n=1 Tax=unclassified Nocardia TaxID=2637762 RepID=UPI00364F1ED2
MSDPEQTVVVVVGIDVYGEDFDGAAPVTGRAGSTVNRPAGKLSSPVANGFRFIQMLVDTHKLDAGLITFYAAPCPQSRHYLEEAENLGVRVEQPTYAELDTLFTETLPATASERLIIHWGGHGVQSGREQYLLCADYGPDRPKAIDLHSLLGKLRSPAYREHPRQLVLIDSCAESDPAASERLAALNFGWQERAADTDQQVILAAAPGLLAVERRRSGVFSTEVLGALRDEWPPVPEVLASTLARAFDARRTSDRTQTPYVITHISACRGRPDGEQEIHRSVAFADEAHLRQLLEIVAGTPDRTQRAARGRAGLPVEPRDWYTGESIASRKSQAARFAGAIAADPTTPSAVKQRLLKWLSSAADDWDLQPDEVRTIHADIDRSRSPYVLVCMNDSIDKYGEPELTTAHVFYESAEGVPIYTGEGEHPSLAAALSEVVRSAPELAPATVDFMAPVMKWHKRFDKIEIEMADGSKEPLGRVAIVAIRPEERHNPRTRTDDHYDLWERRWGYVTAAEHDSLDRAVHWFHGENATIAASAAALRNGTFVCVALTNANRLAPDVMQLLVENGVPAAVWVHRSYALPAGIQQRELEALLGTAPIVDLPRVVHQRRVAFPPDADSRKTAEIVLIWDDPSRPTPYVNFSDSSPIQGAQS